MSKQSQLPPRCPLQKKQTGSVISPPTVRSCKDTGSHSRGGHSKSMSQSSILGEQPSWLSDLLDESDSNSTGIMHRRSASDSMTLLNGLDRVPNLDQLNVVEKFGTDATDNALESNCSYGPNSPRRKDKQSFPESEIVSAFSEYVVQNPVQHLDGHITVSGIGIPQSDSFSGGCASSDVMDNEANPPKRHPGQRSRVRKLQYIAELERTVNVLQNLGSELSVRVATLLQQHVALSMENSTLKQQLIRMQQEKYIVDSEYQSLQEQLKRLKTGLAFRQNRKLHNWPKSAAGNITQSDAIWEMIDMAKLDLN